MTPDQMVIKEGKTAFLKNISECPYKEKDWERYYWERGWLYLGIVFNEGQKAYVEGKKRSACPYKDDRKTAWCLGWENVLAERIDDPALKFKSHEEEE